MAETIIATPVPPGNVQVYSNLVPSLEPGDYEIHVTQDFASQSLESKKSLTVAAPALSVKPSDVQSCYPVPGASEHANILPHICLHDPYLPWERPLSVANSDPVRKTPWLALLTFTEEELCQGQESLKPIIAARTAANHEPPAQSSSGAFTLAKEELLALKGHAQVGLRSTTGNADRLPPGSTLQAIFVNRTLFTALFGVADDAATTWTATQAPLNGKPDLDRYRDLAHVRHTNVAALGKDQTQDQELYSVMIGHRTGIVGASTPHKIMAHLVSLDFPDDVNMSSGPDAFCLISLYSWTYTCIPSEHESFSASLSNLGASVAPLCYSPKQLEAVAPSSSSAVSSWLEAKLSRGYTFIRSIVQTGEPTTALTRGLLIPNNPNTSKVRIPSRDGNSLQVLDHPTGIMDLTYSMAWNLGRVSALSNKPFCESLLRLRSMMHTAATTKAKIAIDTTFMPSQELVGHLKKIESELRTLVSEKGMKGLARSGRWDDGVTESGHFLREQVSWFAEDMRKKFYEELSRMSELFEDAGKSDMDVIWKWVYDIVSLKNLPVPYYLIPDVRVLPHESIRTFYIDDNWLDAFLDGALSVGNHYDDSDIARNTIKVELNMRLAQAARIPRWGLVMRSEQMTGKQEFEVSVPGKRATFLSSTKLANDVRMCLFDRYPNDPEFCTGDAKKIEFSQPPHQQRYSLASLNETSLECEIFGIKAAEVDVHARYKHWPAVWKKNENDGKGTCDGISNLPPIYNWSTRSLVTSHFAKACSTVLEARMPGSNLKAAATPDHLPSAALALELNDNVFSMSIGLDTCIKQSTGLKKTPALQLSTIKVPAPPAPKPPPNDDGSHIPDPEPLARPPRTVDNTPDWNPMRESAPEVTCIHPKITTCVWPVLTFRAPVPASHESGLDLLFMLKSTVGDMADIRTLTLSIPLGRDDTALCYAPFSAPRIRLLAPSKQWRANVMIVGKSTLVVRLDHQVVSRTQGMDPMEDDMSFVLGPLCNTTGKGTVAVALTAHAVGDANASGQSTTFPVLKA